MQCQLLQINDENPKNKHIFHFQKNHDKNMPDATMCIAYCRSTLKPLQLRSFFPDEVKLTRNLVKYNRYQSYKNYQQ